MSKSPRGIESDCPNKVRSKATRSTRGRGFTRDEGFVTKEYIEKFNRIKMDGRICRPVNEQPYY